MEIVGYPNRVLLMSDTHGNMDGTERVLGRRREVVTYNEGDEGGDTRLTVDQPDGIEDHSNDPPARTRTVNSFRPWWTRLTPSY